MIARAHVEQPERLRSEATLDLTEPVRAADGVEAHAFLGGRDII